MVRRMIVPNWVMRVRLWWSGEGDDATRGGEKWGTDAIVAMEEMIWQDGYGGVWMWMEDGGREREKAGFRAERKETPISKSSCRPVTVGWSQGFMEMGNCWWYIQSENRKRTVGAWEPNIMPSAKKNSLGPKFRSNTKK